MAPPELLLGLGLALLGAGMGHGEAPPPEAPPIWCYSRLEEAEGGGACSEPLGEEPLPLADCCLNPAYGYRLRPQGHCRACSPGAWGPWEPWSRCSVTCEEGTQRRGRSRAPGGGHGGDSTEWQLRACDTGCCPVPGGWSPWSPWGLCSVTCGEGSQRRQRSCSEPPPRCGGSCGPGDSEDTRGCQGTTATCPAPVHWGPWSPWSPCSRPWGDISCRSAVGQQRRTRECVGHSPGGAACPTDGRDGIAQFRACYNIQNCIMPGNWSDWSHWGLCTPPCGASPTRSRSRECLPILPEYTLTVPNVGSGGVSNVSFWGAARARCPPLMGQRLRLEETRPCRNVRPCPQPEEV
ncbi:properdin [Hirundo rustica]|uniref:properdin n=1 Tax=Hirundo rustica TaxID=43150 RepID=UPI001A9474D3|nr:properdin [Hirundo rustica]